MILFTGEGVACVARGVLGRGACMAGGHAWHGGSMTGGGAYVAGGHICSAIKGKICSQINPTFIQSILDLDVSQSLF